jgi:hypothetical protein
MESELVTTALAIAQERSDMLSRIRERLEDNDEREAITLMRQYCGISDDKKSNRVN